MKSRLWWATALVVYAAVASGATVTVSPPSNLNGWVPTQSGTAATTFVTGPATPPLGVGSVQLAIGADGNSAAQMRNTTYNGTLLSSISALSYSTFVQMDGSGGQAPYLILNVDYDANGTNDDLLFFEPIYQGVTFFPTNPQGPLAVGVWQTWDAFNGGWYSINGLGASGPGANVKPLATILAAADPDGNGIITVSASGNIRIVTGFGAPAWNNFVGNADAFSITVAGNNTLFDFEPQPSITINDVTLAEGTGGTTNAVFTVTISGAVSQNIDVTYTTADGTATTADLDYTATSGTATITGGNTTTTITVPITPDAKFEGDETFFVNLTGVTSIATIADNQGIGTITNDDLVPSISITDFSGPEGTASNLNLNFPVVVSQSNPSSQTITVELSTAPGTATDGSDFLPISPANPSVVTFNPGVVMQTFSMAVVQDSTREPDETFFANLANSVNATIADPQGVVTIVNDDAVPTILIDNVTAAEGDAGTTNFTFTVTLSNPTTDTVTVQFATADALATAGVDYTPTAGTLTFNPVVSTVQTVTVAVLGDVLLEPDEGFFVNLSAPTNATIGDPQGLGIITNDDGAADVSITKVSPAGSQVARSSAFSYTVTVTNIGPSTATNVTAVDVLPTGVVLSSATPSQGACSGTTTVTCTLGTLASGANATIILAVTAPATDGPIVNNATVTADQTDSDPTNNAAVLAMNVVESIPTLSEWVLIALAGILAVMGAVVVKR